MPYTPPPEIATLSLSQIAELIAERKLPPVANWDPKDIGDSEMQIMADGRWFHQGGEIKRPAMVRAFSTLLRRDADGSHHLVTPQQKLSIIVDDAPFIAVEMQSKGTGKQRSVALRLNTDDLLVIGPDNPIIVKNDQDPPLPYAMVRDNLWAKLSRPVYYELAEIALDESPENPGFWSENIFFPLGGAS